MGEVYRAHDPRLGRDVAIKLLPGDLAHDPERVMRLEREARLLAGLNHPNIVVLHSIEDDGGLRFVTMELIQGTPLADLIVPGGLSATRLMELAIPVAEALVAAHEKGVVHRDLKPANVMVARGGQVKVLDFGLAKLALPPDLDRTQGPTISNPLSMAGEILGTPAYMSPEQVRGEPVDARTDLFSFGVLLFELATGRRPFEGASAAELVSSILRDPPPDLAMVRADLPAGLGRIVGRCLEKNPRQRIQTALDVVNELRALQGSPGGGNPPGVVPSPTGAGPAAPRRTRMRAGLAIGVVLLLVAGAGWVVLQRRSAPRGTDPVAGNRRTVAVLEFGNLTGDPSLDWMKRGASELLATALVQSPELDVFDAQRLGELAAGQDRREASSTPTYGFLARHGIHRAVTGAILRSGSELRIQGRIVDTADGRLVHAYEVAGPAETGMFHLVGRLVTDMQVALEVNLTGDREAESWLREITTSSADAYRLYLRGHQALLGSRWKEAADAYEKALELDSTFVAARTELSGVYWNLGDETNLDLTRAAMHRLRGRADHRNRLRIDLLESVVGGDSPGLVRAASALVDLYPENRFYTYLLGRGYYMTGQFQRCLQTLRPLVEQRYEWAWTYALAARSAMHLGDAAEARRLFESGLEVTRDPELGYAYVRFLRQQGDRERIRAVIEEGLRSPIIAESPVAEGELRVELAKELNARGDREQARAEIGRALVLLPRNDEAWPEADSLARAMGRE
jgi:tetratricopeptide (TPR) repeat protein/TolB-like protein